jgi:hypothetical protein
VDGDELRSLEGKEEERTNALAFWPLALALASTWAPRWVGGRERVQVLWEVIWTEGLVEMTASEELELGAGKGREVRPSPFDASYDP